MPTWTELFPSGTGPGIREIGQSIGYDPNTNTPHDTNTLVIFGAGGANVTNDFWVLSNANGHGETPVWTELSPSGAPPSAGAFNTMTYDPSTNVATIVGGADSSGLLGDTWVLSNAMAWEEPPVWTQIGTGSTYFPEPRLLHTAVYSSSINKMTIFGGRITASDSLDTNDVFELNHANGH